MVAPNLKAMRDLILIFEFITLYSYAIADSEILSINEMIAEASESSKGLGVHYDSGDGIITTELDMMFKIEDWRDFMMDQNSTLTKRKAIRMERFRWKDKQIPYIFRDYFSDNEKKEVESAMNDWNRLTCIRFRKASSRDKNKIYLSNGQGCYSFIGMQTGGQNLFLAKNCRYKRVILHELGHAIGFFHEQGRTDRDKYVYILKENVKSSFIDNFDKESSRTVNLFNIPYDYTSIMHYGAYDFSYNGKKTIITKDKRYQDVIGKAKILSFNDVKYVNLMYKCSEHCPKKSCPRNGFVAKDCQCYCPDPKNTMRKCSDAGGGVIKPDKNKNTCKDSHKLCKLWSNLGECSKNPTWMLVNCKLSCKKCKPNGDCKDNHKMCSYWAKVGECKKNPNYMRNNCKLSCKNCAGQSQKNEVDCIDKNKHCKMWSRVGECKKNPSYMLKNCQQSCNSCKQRGGTYSSEPCSDEHARCGSWALRGECNSNKDYMLSYCKKSCKVCV
ncbi:zinc metalloproteinase nas-13-like [Argonauta hians]